LSSVQAQYTREKNICSSLACIEILVNVFPCGDVVVKVPFDAAHAIEAVTIDVAIAPFVRALGVRAPELIAFDDSRSVLPVPFAIFRRVQLCPALDRVTGQPAADQAAWEAVGRQLAIVHAVQMPERGQPDGGQQRVDPYGRTPCPPTAAPANVLVDARSGRFRALIDWAGAGWIDPAWDFAAVSLDLVPFILNGHRGVAPLANDDTAEARICWCQIQMRLYFVRHESLDELLTERLARDIGQLRRFARESGLHG